MMENLNNLYESNILNFLNKEVESVDDLERLFSDGLEIRKGKNEEKKLSSDTEILIVGTAVPPDIAYFFTGKDSWLYKVIDKKRKTALSKLQDKLNSPDGHLIQNDCVEEIKQILKREKIDFLDITNLFLTKKNSHSDNDIVAYSIDYSQLTFVKNNQNHYKRIIPITRVAEAVLKRRLGMINVKYERFFARNKKLLKVIQQKWYNIF